MTLVLFVTALTLSDSEVSKCGKVHSRLCSEVSMSSCKFFKERARSNTCHRDPQQRIMPPLLRLDSTGEISSSSVFNSGQKPRHSRSHMLKGLIDGFNMATMIETANSYFGTAASYVEGICTRGSRQNLTRSDSDTTILEYLKKLNQPRPVIGKCHSGSLDSNSFGSMSFANTNNSGYSTEDNMATNTVGMTVPVSSSLFGVIQNTFVNSNCRSEKSKPEPYIPPPVKKKMMEHSCKNGGVRVDPRLTPYNARLLERSKSQRLTRETAKQHKCWHHERPVQVSNHITISRKKMRSPPPAFVADNTPQSCVQTESEKQSCETEPQADKLCDPENIHQENDIVRDWFEYENEHSDVIPMHVDVSCNLQKSPVPKDSDPNAYTKSSNSKSNCPPLHSWLNVELDLGVQKATEESLRSSHESEKSQHPCDKSEPANFPRQNQEKCSKGANNDAAKTVAGHTESKTGSVFPQVLYVRNTQNGRKCRPSSKKRRRHKTHPNEVNGKTAEKGSAKCSASSVAFILGIDTEGGKSCSQSFLVPCDTDSSSDWSDSDLEIDGVDGAVEEEFCPLTSPFSLFNLDVMCSVQPTTPPCSTIDSVNLAWQLNVSVNSEQKPKKNKGNSPAKKVQFAEGKDLETVHPMVAWSYAYAAARKGPWEEIARDRGRFQRRITDGEKILSPILDNIHRQKIYANRFQTDS